jgi:hypothetical protein
LSELFEPVQIEYVPGVGIDLSLDREIELIVMAMEGGVVAYPICRAVPLVRESRIMQTVRGVEMNPSGDTASWH